MKRNVHLTFFLAHPLQSSTGGEKVPEILEAESSSSQIIIGLLMLFSQQERARDEKAKLFILESHNVGGSVAMSLSVTPK